MVSLGNQASLLSNIGVSPSGFSWDAVSWANRFGRVCKVPHRRQVEICDAPARWIIVAWGRRGGKTSCMGEIKVPRWCMAPGHDNTKVNVFALFQAQANLTFNFMMSMVEGGPLEAMIKDMSNADPPWVLWKNDCKLHFKNLHKGGKHARGDGSDFTLIDECFPAGTLVDGRPIETIRVGDRVLSLNEATGLMETRRVVHVGSRETKAKLYGLTAAGRSVWCTGNHPFLTPMGWVVASDIEAVRDKVAVRCSPGAPLQWVGVDGVEVLEQASGSDFGGLCPGGRVYNLEIEDTHTFTANGFVVHNSSFIPGNIKNSVVSPMSAASKFQERVDISTPNGKEQFYLDHLAGRHYKKNHDMQSYHMPSWGNPALSKDFLRGERDRMTRHEFLTEYGALFLDDMLAQFPWELIVNCVNEEIKVHYHAGQSWVEEEPIHGHKYRGGWDPSDRIDRSALVISDVTVEPRRVVYAKNIGGFGYLAQEREIALVSHKYNNAYILMDTTKHDTTLEHLVERDPMRGQLIPELANPVNIDGLPWNNEYKREMMDLLRRDMERNAWELPPWDPMLEDMKFYRRERTRSGLITMNAGEGRHDDFVSALGMANWIAQDDDEITVTMVQR